MSLTATKASACLHSIHLSSPDPQHRAAFRSAFACRDSEWLDELTGIAEAKGLAPKGGDRPFRRHAFGVTGPDGNWTVEVSAELKGNCDRPVKEWPREEHTLDLWGRGGLHS